MRRCRVIKLTDANEAFLAFCEAYGTDEQEKLRARYERLDEREKKAKGAVRADGDNPMRDMQHGLPFGIRPPA